MQASAAAWPASMRQAPCAAFTAAATFTHGLPSSIAPPLSPLCQVRSNVAGSAVLRADMPTTNDISAATAGGAVALAAPPSLPLLVRPPARRAGSRGSRPANAPLPPQQQQEQAQQPQRAPSPATATVDSTQHGARHSRQVIAGVEQKAAAASSSSAGDASAAAAPNSLLQQIWPDYGAATGGWQVPAADIEQSWSAFSSGPVTNSMDRAGAAPADASSGSTADTAWLLQLAEQQVSHLVARMCPTLTAVPLPGAVAGATATSSREAASAAAELLARLTGASSEEGGSVQTGAKSRHSRRARATGKRQASGSAAAAAAGGNLWHSSSKSHTGARADMHAGGLSADERASAAALVSSLMAMDRQQPQPQLSRSVGGSAEGQWHAVQQAVSTMSSAPSAVASVSTGANSSSNSSRSSSSDDAAISSDSFASYLALSAMESAIIAVAYAPVQQQQQVTAAHSNSTSQSPSTWHGPATTLTWGTSHSHGRGHRRAADQLLATARALRAELAQPQQGSSTSTGAAPASAYAQLNDALLQLLRMQQVQLQRAVAAGSWAESAGSATTASSTAMMPPPPSAWDAAVSLAREFGSCMSAHTAAHMLLVLAKAYSVHMRHHSSGHMAVASHSSPTPGLNASSAPLDSVTASIDDLDSLAELVAQQQQQQHDTSHSLHGGSSSSSTASSLGEERGGRVRVAGLPRELRVLSSCCHQLLRTLHAGMASAPPSTVVTALHALAHLPGAVRSLAANSAAGASTQQAASGTGGSGGAGVRGAPPAEGTYSLRAAAVRAVGPALLAWLQRMMHQLPAPALVSALHAVARTGTGCRLLPVGFLRQALAHLTPALQHSCGCLPAAGAAGDAQAQSAAAAGLQPRDVAVLGWSLAHMGQTPPAAWRQVYSTLCARAAPLFTPAQLVMVCSTLRVWQPAPQPHHQPHHDRQHARRQQHMAVHELHLPQQHAADNVSAAVDAGSLTSAAAATAAGAAPAWPAPELVRALSGALLALLPAMSPGQVAAVLVELAGSGWRPTAPQLRALQAHWEQQQPQSRGTAAAAAAAAGGAGPSRWSARHTSVLLGALAHSHLQQAEATGVGRGLHPGGQPAHRPAAGAAAARPTRAWLVKVVGAVEAEVQQVGQQEQHLTTAHSQAVMPAPSGNSAAAAARIAPGPPSPAAQQAAMALCRVLSALPHLAPPGSCLGSMTPATPAAAAGAGAGGAQLGPLHRATRSLLSSCVTPGLLAAAPHPRHVLRLLEGVSLLLGPHALPALLPGALPAAEAVLVAQAASLPGGGWRRLNDSYARLGCAPGPELEAAIMLHL